MMEEFGPIQTSATTPTKEVTVSNELGDASQYSRSQKRTLGAGTIIFKKIYKTLGYKSRNQGWFYISADDKQIVEAKI